MHNSLVIHGGALGDFVMTLRVVAALRANGANHVGFLGGSGYAELARRAGVDQYFDLHTGGYHALFSKDAELPVELCRRLARFSIVVDLLTGPSSPLRQRLRHLGISCVTSIDPRPRPGCDGPVSDQWLDDLRAAGLNAIAGPPEIDCVRESVSAARDELRRMTATTGRIALIHPGSGSPAKCWPLVEYLQLMEALRAEKWAVVAVVGPVELERFRPADLVRLRSVAPTVEERPLDNLADLLAAADLFVGNDSGIAHLAAAVGADTIAIFGPTPSEIWRPLGRRVKVVTGPATAWPTAMDILAAIRTISGPAPH
jgi:ADP-heptose:LPS heptosyltransferase